eukprot:767945-Hanusia_phi.AAC.18
MMTVPTAGWRAVRLLTLKGLPPLTESGLRLELRLHIRKPSRKCLRSPACTRLRSRSGPWASNL